MSSVFSRIPKRCVTPSRWNSVFSPENVLSVENREQTIARFTKVKPIRQHTTTPTRQAAVLIPLCMVDGQVALLYTLRAAHLKSHRGQVSFPGGMQDGDDKSLEMTALRETEEELGINPNEIDVWGRGALVVNRGATKVMPIVGQIRGDLDLKRLKINSSEVSHVFAVSLAALCDPKQNGHTQFRGNLSLPVYLGGARKIWGLTAVITHAFLTALLPKKAYNNIIKVIPPVQAAAQ